MPDQCALAYLWAKGRFHRDRRQHVTTRSTFGCATVCFEWGHWRSGRYWCGCHTIASSWTRPSISRAWQYHARLHTSKRCGKLSQSAISADYERLVMPLWPPHQDFLSPRSWTNVPTNVRVVVGAIAAVVHRNSGGEGWLVRRDRQDGCGVSHQCRQTGGEHRVLGRTVVLGACAMNV